MTLSRHNSDVSAIFFPLSAVIRDLGHKYADNSSDWDRGHRVHTWECQMYLCHPGNSLKYFLDLP